MSLQKQRQCAEPFNETRYRLTVTRMRRVFKLKSGRAGYKSHAKRRVAEADLFLLHTIIQWHKVNDAGEFRSGTYRIVDGGPNDGKVVRRVTYKALAAAWRYRDGVESEWTHNLQTAGLSRLEKMGFIYRAYEVNDSNDRQRKTLWIGVNLDVVRDTLDKVNRERSKMGKGEACECEEKDTTNCLVLDPEKAGQKSTPTLGTQRTSSKIKSSRSVAPAALSQKDNHPTPAAVPPGVGVVPLVPVGTPGAVIVELPSDLAYITLRLKDFFPETLLTKEMTDGLKRATRLEKDFQLDLNKFNRWLHMRNSGLDMSQLQCNLYTFCKSWRWVWRGVRNRELVIEDQENYFTAYNSMADEAKELENSALRTQHMICGQTSADDTRRLDVPCPDLDDISPEFILYRFIIAARFKWPVKTSMAAFLPKLGQIMEVAPHYYVMLADHLKLPVGEWLGYGKRDDKRLRQKFAQQAARYLRLKAQQEKFA
jgi:hypothetical protein